MPPRPSTSTSSSRLQTPSRRMTLGAVPSNQKNRRMSVDSDAGIPGSAVKPKRPPVGRKSMLPRVGGGRENAPPSAQKLPPAMSRVPTAPPSPRVPPSPGALGPTAASRRRSMGGASIARRNSIIPSTSKAVEDPRSIHDKAFQHKAINSLLNFLKESNYPHAVTQRTLSKPSNKDFNQILSFMLRMTDPNFQNETNMKFEDEVCLHFKCLGYPFTISKTSLAAAGSPHTWPSLLAALSWLGEHLMRLRLDAPAEYLVNPQPFETLEELQVNTDKAFYQYLMLSYHAFMHGEANRINELELALQKRFDDDDKLLEDELERIDDLNATIIERINMLRQDSGNLPDWQKKREDYLVDLEQFQDLNKKMDEHKKSLQQKKEDLVKELADTNEKLARMNVHIQDLKQTVESQDLAPNEVIKLENESKGAIEAMDRLQKVKEKREKELAENDAILEKHVVVCETVMDQLNSKLGDVRSFAEFSDSFKQYKFMLKKDKLLESDPIETFGVNCKESLEPAIASAIQETETKASTAKLNSQEALDRLDESESNKQEALSMKQIVLDKIAKSEESLQHEQDAHATKLAVREREIDAMERKVEARRDPMVLEEQMAVMERQLAELEALREKHEAENIHKKAMVMEEIESACDLMMEQEDFLRQKVKEVEQYRTQKLAVAPSINVPSGFSLDK